MPIIIDATWTESVNALGVIVALLISAYQLWQQRVDGKLADQRHDEQERKQAERFAGELADRRKERLTVYFPQWVQSLYNYAGEMHLFHTMRAEVSVAEKEFAADPERKAAVVSQIRRDCIRQAKVTRDLMNEALVASMAIRMDMPPQEAAVVDAMMDRLMQWQDNDTVGFDIAGDADKFVERHIAALKSSDAPSRV